MVACTHLEHDPVLFFGFLNHTHVAAHCDGLWDCADPQLVQMFAPPSETQSESLSVVVGQPHPHPQACLWTLPVRATLLRLLLFGWTQRSSGFPCVPAAALRLVLWCRFRVQSSAALITDSKASILPPNLPSFSTPTSSFSFFFFKKSLCFPGWLKGDEGG